MQGHKKLSARILSMALTVAMVATMMPSTVFATEGDVPLGASSLGASSIGTIRSFEKLEDRFEPSTGEGASKDVYALNVELNTPFEDLNLPDELTAMVARTTTVSAPAEDEPVVDSGKPSEPVVDEVIPDEGKEVDEDTVTDETVSGNQPASPSDAEEEVKEEIKDEDVPLAPEPEDEETTVTTTEQETIPVTWKSDKEYKSDENGKFIYTAELPEGFILADGVKLPQIYVLVGNGNALPGVMPRAGVYCTCMVQCVGFSTNDCQYCLAAGVMAGDICKPRGLLIDDVTVSGIVGKELVDGITTTLTTVGEGSKFVRSDGTEDVTNWFTGLPAGITVEATFDEAHDSYITLTFSGTPTEQSTAAMSITIPGDSTSNFIDPFGANYQSVRNANAKFNIEANPLAHNLSTDGALELNIDFGQLPQIVCYKGCSETNPHIVTSNGQTNNTITLAGGDHYVVLNNVNISSEYNSPISIESGSGSEYLYLTIKGTNTLTATGDGKAGIFSKNGRSMDAGLIINGEKTDSLTVQGGKGAAGIGGNDALSGHITINGGVINATGGESGAGIGSGTNVHSLIGDPSYFTINDGTITATGGGNGAAGIGLGDHGAVGSSGMVITITGGDVTAVGTGASAYGYGSAPGIGTVNHDVDIAVEGGIVNAQGDGSAFNIGGGGITTLTFTDTMAKYNTATSGTATYTGAINISNGKIYEGAEGTANVAKDIKSMPIYKGTEAANVSSTPSAKTDTTVTLAAVTAPTDETIEYAYSTTNTAPTTGWQDSTAFTGLTANTQYYFFARVKANDKHWEGAASTGTAITTAGAATFVPVTGITGVPTTATAGTPLTLIGTVAPTNATNKTIVWTVKSAGATGATISGSTLNTTAAGTVTVTATITNGLTASSNYTKDFSITVNAGINKTTLSDAIANAKSIMENTVISIQSGSDVSTSTYWVLPDIMSAAKAALSEAEAILANPNATQAEIDNAVVKLNAKVNIDFKNAKKLGTKSSGSGGGGGGSSSGGSSTTPPTKTEPVKGESNTTATVDKNGNTTTTVTDKNIADAVQAAKDAANKKGVNAGEVTAVINVTSPANSNPNTVTVNLPKTVQQQVINNKIDNVAIVIDKPDISIGMNLATITEMNKQANADIALSATRTDATKLSTEAKNAIGNRPAFDLKATYNSGAKSITSFGTGSVSVAIPYTLQSGEVAGGLYAVYIDGNGKANYLTNSSYDAEAKVLRFATNHFSVYGIGYKAPMNFTDIATHWAKTDIEFVVNRGLMSGTSNTTFAPNTAITRGMFVTALGRLAGIDTSSYKTSKFTDVKADAYYAPYVNWAATKGIVKGTNDTTFAPDQAITRQEMATIMSSYAKAMGYTVPETRAAVTFADNGSIASWAAPAVKQMQMAGVLNGKNGNKFDPTGTATRGEISAMLHRYVELVIDRTTTEGWTQNDSGSSLYYKGGKAVTGAQTIGSVAYNFNGYGETTRKTMTAGATTTNPAVPADGKNYTVYVIKKNDWLSKIAIANNCTVDEIIALNSIKNQDLIYEGQQIKIPQK